jgi:hypothetical protein
MKLYLKVIGCSCYTWLPQSFPAAQTAPKMVAAPGTGTRPKAQRLYYPKNGGQKLNKPFR